MGEATVGISWLVAESEWGMVLVGTVMVGGRVVVAQDARVLGGSRQGTLGDLGIILFCHSNFATFTMTGPAYGDMSLDLLVSKVTVLGAEVSSPTDGTGHMESG